MCVQGVLYTLFKKKKDNVLFRINVRNVHRTHHNFIL